MHPEWCPVSWFVTWGTGRRGRVFAKTYLCPLTYPPLTGVYRIVYHLPYLRAPERRAKGDFVIGRPGPVTGLRGGRRMCPVLHPTGRPVFHPGTRRHRNQPGKWPVHRVNNVKCECDGKKNKAQILILILGVLIGASGYLANSLFLWNASVNKDKSDIAEGLYLDVSSLEDPLVAADREFLANPDDNYIFVHGTPLYPDNGLYFVYQRDISRMDRKIALDAFTFYNHVLSAERDRNQIFEIKRMGDLRELTSAERRRQQILTQSVAHEVNTSVSLLPTLKQELDAAT